MEDQIFTPQETPTLDDVMNTEQEDVVYSPLDNIINDEIHTQTEPSDVQIPESEEIETGEPIEVTIEDQIITPKKNRIDFQGYELDNISEADNENDVPSIKQVRDIVEEVESEKQDKLSAGDNITIEGNVISAKDTTYTAGSGLNLTGTEFSIGTIENSMIGDDQVTGEKIADNAIDTENIIDGKVTSEKIKWDTIKVKLLTGTDSGGSSGVLQLNDDPANYKYIEVFFKDDQSFNSSVKIFNNNSSSNVPFNLYYIKASGSAGTIFLVTKRMELVSTGISRGAERVATITNGSTPTVVDNNIFRITDVIGYK